MPAPDNASELLPISWQIIIGAVTLAATVAGATWKFLNTFKGDPAHNEHIILERADLADLNPIRDFVREFRPALEKLSHIEYQNAQTINLIQEALSKLNRMERDAQVAKEVREELARRVDDQDRQSRRNRARDNG